MKQKIHNYKIIKAIELGIYLIMEVAFLIILITNRTLRSGIFIDSSLFTLCTMMYVASLFILLVLLFDFFKLLDLKREGHELEKLAFLDTKTGIPNRTSCSMLFDTYTTPKSMEDIGCCLVEINNIRDINACFGKPFGDKVIRDFTKILEGIGENYGFVGRNGGNEFLAIIKECDKGIMENFIASLNEAVTEYSKSLEGCDIEIRTAFALYNDEKVATISEFIAKAYDRLRS